MGICRSLLGASQLHASDQADTTTEGTNLHEPPMIVSAAYFASAPLPPISSNSSDWISTHREILSKLEANSPSVVELDLRHEGIGNDGVRALTKVLRRNTKLKVLLLSDNNIVGGKGIMPLATLLGTGSAKNHSNSHHCSIPIEELDLQGNQLGDSGAEVIGKVLLPHNTTLKELYVCQNSFSRNGKQHLLQGLIQNYFLEQLVIRNDSNRLVMEDRALQKEINYYLRLNRAGRRILREEDHHSTTNEKIPSVPTGLWAFIFAHISNELNVLYYFIQAKPDLVSPNVCL